MGVKQIFTRSCINTNAERAGEFVCPGRDDPMSTDDKTSAVNMSVKKIFTRSYTYTPAENAGKFVCLGRNDLMSTDDKTSE